mmetsp:Transcript_10658/g.16042  ORF Transcript_10658/g.16042 Transcript_10658/m.16042 type:complete len:465 (+) Transcript_10658:26-1420(+)
MDLRIDAENRAQRISARQEEGESSESQFVESRRSLRLSKSQTNKSPFGQKPNGLTRILTPSINVQYGATDYQEIGVSNETPKAAYLAEIDYKLNGRRARVNSGEFLNPRWVPDEEDNKCCGCASEFDWVNRRHHCRHCGKLFCSTCSSTRSLLPEEFGIRDPQRVCNHCSNLLAPYQSKLTNTMANHQRMNSIDIASNSSCNIRRYFNLPYSSTLGSEIRKAAYSIHNLMSSKWIRDKAIPVSLISCAKGLAFITVLKGGFGFGAKMGTGLVIARLASGEWSGPSAIASVGLSWGFQVGADLTDHVIVLTSDEAVRAFSGYGQLTIGGEIDVAIGPIGRSGSGEFHVADKGLAAAYSYSQSRGLFAGVSLDGSVIFARTEVNHIFYGRRIQPEEILSGQQVGPPRAAEPLYSALADAVACSPQQRYSMPSKRRLVLDPVAEVAAVSQSYHKPQPQKPAAYHIVN